MLCIFFKVHGIVLDTIEFVKGILTTEMNSATDNPVSFCMLVQTFPIHLLNEL